MIAEEGATPGDKALARRLAGVSRERLEFLQLSAQERRPLAAGSRVAILDRRGPHRRKVQQERRTRITGVEWQEDWLDDAPDPHEVNSRVAGLVARRVKLLSERWLICEDHSDAMRLLVAADTYYDLLAHFCMFYTPDAAAECFSCHKHFAQQVVSARLDGGAEAMDDLVAMASYCSLSRGRMCAECRLPMVLHVTDAPGQAVCPRTS